MIVQNLQGLDHNLRFCRSRIFHRHLIRSAGSACSRHLQGEHAIAVIGDFSSGSGYRRSASDDIAFSSLGLLDIVFLPPVQTFDNQLALTVGDQILSQSTIGGCHFSDRAVALLHDTRVVAVTFIQEVQSCLGIGRMRESESGILIGPGNLEGGSRNRLCGRCSLLYLGQLQLANHLIADILGLVDIGGVAQIEGIHVIGCDSAGVGCLCKVAVQGSCSRGSQLMVGIVGLVMVRSAMHKLEDIQQRICVCKFRMQIVMERIRSLQCSRLAKLMQTGIQIVIGTIKRSAFNVGSRSKVAECEMPYGFTISGVRVGSM